MEWFGSHSMVKKVLEKELEMKMFVEANGGKREY
jgi:hypothetical protein